MTQISSLQEALLEWFAANKRDLPWRHTRDPYRVLVSEVMLQQTQVDRVVPKYHAFLEAFPTLQALAEAPAAEVIRLWQGLGYNRRAVNLQRAARTVVEEHGGSFPQTVEGLRALPGIGAYTAGAVACFAFEQDVAFLDTNIRRAVRRLLVGPDESAATSDNALIELAARAVPQGRGWEWNQAIMELGATICTAAAPACWRCPVRAHCRAYAARKRADENVFAASVAVADPAPPPATRRVAERREAPYGGSNRFYRGRAVDALRTLAAGETLALPALGPRVKDGYDAADEPWLRALLEGLARDGLAHLDETGKARLP